AHGWTSLVASAGGRMLDRLTSGGSRHIKLPLDSKNPLTIWRNAGRLARLIRQEEIALIHARSRAPAWSALIAARRTGIPFVTTYHGSYNQKSRLKAWYNSVMARGDVVIANSGWTRDLIVARNPWAKDQVQVVHRGTDLEEFSPKSVSEDRCQALRDSWGIQTSDTVIVKLARMTSWKGHAVLINAVAQVVGDFPDLKVVLAGDAQGRNDYIAGLQSAISKLNLHNNVLMPGHCDDPAAAVAVSDLVVVASTQAEAFGRAAVEAGALERPVIVSNIGAVEETVLAASDVGETDFTGWKVPPGDADGMAQALLDALKLSAKARREIGQRARNHAQANFSLQQMCDKTLAIYEDLLASSGVIRSPKV
ncbi:MAG: glycosyltransferase family 4 protein, partial [Pseudomonadota bacterium]